MKYLLSILVLFSSLSFSKSYLICDEPYIFYPDKEERKLLEIGDSSILVTKIIDLIIDEVPIMYFDTTTQEGEDFKETTTSYFWAKGLDNTVAYHNWIDRKTLVIHNWFDNVDMKDSEKPKCKVATRSEFSDAFKELSKIADEQTDKSNQERQKELDKRKI